VITTTEGINIDDDQALLYNASSLSLALTVTMPALHELSNVRYADSIALALVERMICVLVYKAFFCSSRSLDGISRYRYSSANFRLFCR